MKRQFFLMMIAGALAVPGMAHAGVICVNGKEHSLEPGQKMQSWWNNASPAKAVWSANAVPVITGTTATGFNQDTKVEVTRLWRRLKVVEKSPNLFSDVDIEHEIHYEVKNIGNTKARFNVYLCAVS